MSLWPIEGLLLLTLVAFACVGGIHRRFKREGFRKLSPPAVSPDTPLPADQWFTQMLDHSDPTNNATWQQRYQVVTDYYKCGGPVFLLLGGEGPASPAWLVEGNFVNYAKMYNASLMQIEHRFYGESHPTSDVSVENLRYLTSEQALGDVAYFVEGINALYNYTSDTKWIAFGGSYSGSLAAWVRLKYPHLIHGAMSASGPLEAKVDFYEYISVVRDSLSHYGKGKKCSTYVHRADKIMTNLLKNPLGREVIQYLFRLCDPINITNQNDIYSLEQTLADTNVAEIVQYNKDNRAFRSSAWNISIDKICHLMGDKSLGDPLVRYAAVNSLMMDTYEETCVDYKYDNMITELRNTSWDSDGVASSGRQWTYQTCTEFGFFQTSEKWRQLYRRSFPLKFFIQECTDIFGEAFTEEVVNRGVNRTNLIYGGKDLKATRVVYVHGSVDPWHKLGICQTRLEESPAIFIKGTAHCANMYPPSPSDPPALTAAREKVGKLIGQWLQDE